MISNEKLNILEKVGDSDTQEIVKEINMLREIVVDTYTGVGINEIAFGEDNRNLVYELLSGGPR